MNSLREMLEIMKNNENMVNVYVSPNQPNKHIYTGNIESVGTDCLVMTPEPGKYGAVIPLDKIVMVSIAMTIKM